MEDETVKYEKIILIMMMIMIIGIIIMIGIIGSINKNTTEDNQIQKDEISNLEEGGEEYNIEQLNNFDFKVTNLNSSVKSKIKDINQFLLDMKEYIYINGLVQANCAECINVKELSGKVVIEFQLNNPETTIITATINLTDNTYIFSDNYQYN